MHTVQAITDKHWAVCKIWLYWDGQFFAVSWGGSFINGHCINSQHFCKLSGHAKLPDIPDFLEIWNVQSVSNDTL